MDTRAFLTRCSHTAEGRPEIPSLIDPVPSSEAYGTEGFRDIPNGVKNLLGDIKRFFTVGPLPPVALLNAFEATNKTVDILERYYESPTYLARRRLVEKPIKLPKHQLGQLEGKDGARITEAMVDASETTLNGLNADYCSYIGTYTKAMEPIARAVKNGTLNQELLSTVRSNLQRSQRPETALAQQMEQRFYMEPGNRRYRARTGVTKPQYPSERTITPLDIDGVVAMAGLAKRLLLSIMERERDISRAIDRRVFGFVDDADWQGYRQLDTMRDGPGRMFERIDREEMGDNPYAQTAYDVGRLLLTDPKQAEDWYDILPWFSVDQFHGAVMINSPAHELVTALIAWIEASVK